MVQQGSFIERAFFIGTSLNRVGSWWNTAEKIAGAMPLHLAYFFNCCAIGKVTTSIHGICDETVQPSVFLVPRLQPGNAYTEAPASGSVPSTINDGLSQAILG